MPKDQIHYALITGASGLIGTELCKKYLAEGFHVYGLDLVEGDLRDPNYTYLKCDLSKESSIKASFKKIKSLNVVVNNAALTNITFKSFEAFTIKDWEKGLAVNLTSIMSIAKLAYPMLKKSKGAMINIASSRHLMSEPNTMIYSASKGATVSLTHSLAITWSPEIRVNSISPGWIANPKEKLKPKDHAQHPVGRVGHPKDIAEMAFFLSSEKAGFITGQDFIVDGGMVKKMIYE